MKSEKNCKTCENREPLLNFVVYTVSCRGILSNSSQILKGIAVMLSVPSLGYRSWPSVSVSTRSLSILQKSVRPAAFMTIALESRILSSMSGRPYLWAIMGCNSLPIYAGAGNSGTGIAFSTGQSQHGTSVPIHAGAGNSRMGIAFSTG